MSGSEYKSKSDSRFYTGNEGGRPLICINSFPIELTKNFLIRPWKDEYDILWTFRGRSLLVGVFLNCY